MIHPRPSTTGRYDLGIQPITDPHQLAVLRAVAAAGGAIDRNALREAVRPKSSEISAALTSLADAGRIRLEVRVTPGRPQTVIRTPD